jgi:crotonobetainyl-CoA:carnitine CoA-transferase CaiB-like acyl-CoA transferase
VEVSRGSSRIGEHTREVLAEAGLTAGAIEALMQGGAILTAEAGA